VVTSWQSAQYFFCWVTSVTNVEYDKKNKRWVVDLKQGGHELKTFLEDGDAEKCLNGIQCVSLGVEIAQLRANIDRMPTR